ncbi:MAG TPA: hypothetical protein VII99_09630 [Bacteroidia bacterium]
MIDKKEVELKSEAVNELLSASPPWIIRWGLSVVFFILLCLLSFSFFIKRPVNRVNLKKNLNVKTAISDTVKIIVDKESIFERMFKSIHILK